MNCSSLAIIFQGSKILDNLCGNLIEDRFTLKSSHEGSKLICLLQQNMGKFSNNFQRMSFLPLDLALQKDSCNFFILELTQNVITCEKKETIKLYIVYM